MKKRRTTLVATALNPTQLEQIRNCLSGRVEFYPKVRGLDSSGTVYGNTIKYEIYVDESDAEYADHLLATGGRN